MVTWWQLWHPRAWPIEKTAAKSYLHSHFGNGIQCSHQWEENKAIVSWKEMGWESTFCTSRGNDEKSTSESVYQVLTHSGGFLVPHLPPFHSSPILVLLDNAAQRQQNVGAQSKTLFCYQNILFTSATIPWTPNPAFLKHRVLPKYCNMLIISAFNLNTKLESDFALRNCSFAKIPVTWEMCKFSNSV